MHMFLHTFHLQQVLEDFQDVLFMKAGDTMHEFCVSLLEKGGSARAVAHRGRADRLVLHRGNSEKSPSLDLHVGFHLALSLLHWYRVPHGQIF